MCTIQGPPPRKPIPQPMAVDQPFPVYLDHNATTPLCDEAWEAMASVRHAWGNPSSLHPYGLEAKYHLEEARKIFQKSLGAAKPECVIFTGSGTEANNLGVVGTIYKILQHEQQQKQQDDHDGSNNNNHSKKQNVIITTVYEHPAIEEVMQKLEKEDGLAEVIRCEVDRDTGMIDVAAFERHVWANIDRLALVTVMHANNELGTINPIADLVRIVRSAEQQGAAPSGSALPVMFHTDASQSVGKIDTDISRLGVDMMTVCAHKFYGPKGVGALVVRDPATCTPSPVLRGAKHERGIRPSTENVMQVAAAAAALQSAVTNLEANAKHARACRDLLYNELRKRLVEQNDFQLIENGSVELALPNTLNIAIFHKPSQLFISAARMITSLGRQMAMSSGSACHATDDEELLPVSTPLQAVGVDLARAIGTLRLATGKLNKLEDIPRAAQVIAYACKAQMPQDYHRDSEMASYDSGASYTAPKTTEPVSHQPQPAETVLAAEEAKHEHETQQEHEKKEQEEREKYSHHEKQNGNGDGGVQREPAAEALSPAPPTAVPPQDKKLLSPRKLRRRATTTRMFDRLGGSYTIPTERDDLLRVWQTYEEDETTQSLVEKNTETGDISIPRELFVREFMEFESDLGLKVTVTDIESVFSHFDRNNDGKMSWYEFYRFMLQRAKQ